MPNPIKHKVIALLLLLGLSACNWSEMPDAKSTTGRQPTLAETPDPDETVRGAADPAIVTLDLNTSLHERRLAVTDELPGNIIIPTTNLNAVPITAALQAVLSGTDVSLSWNTGALGSRLVTVMNLSGPLPKVVDKICSAAKVFCDYRHGSLELSEKETFVVALPPVARTSTSSSASTTGSSGGSSGSGNSSTSSGGGTSGTGSTTFSTGGTNSMVDAISQLIGNNEKAQIDEQGGNILYTASVDGEDRVGQYLTQLRTGRPLVVLQMYIWEVNLSKENAEGINWSQLGNDTINKSLSLSGTSAIDSVAATTGSVSLGAVTGGIISANVVASFLATKGRVQTISNPQITFVSGTSAELKVGGTQRYISQVGTLTTSNISGTTNGSNGNSSTNTVSTDSIDTGLTIDVLGSYENGVVFANMGLTLRNLISLNPTNSGGGTIDLPQTTDESMNTVLRVRPGDSLVLAGLVSSADTSAGQAFPTGDDSGIPLYGDEQKQNRELVIIVKPSIILFSDKSATEEAKKKDTSKPLPDAVVIDGDGSHVLRVPQARLKSDAAGSPQPLAPAPELMLHDPQATSMQNVPVSSSDDQAPVDKLLMQRGFSHAFDQLLKPAGSTASNGGVN